MNNFLISGARSILSEPQPTPLLAERNEPSHSSPQRPSTRRRSNHPLVAEAIIHSSLKQSSHSSLKQSSHSSPKQSSACGQNNHPLVAEATVHSLRARLQSCHTSLILIGL
jgi:hypothetical protein